MTDPAKPEPQPTEAENLLAKKAGQPPMPEFDWLGLMNGRISLTPGISLSTQTGELEPPAPERTNGTEATVVSTAPAGAGATAGTNTPVGTEATVVSPKTAITPANIVGPANMDNRQPAGGRKTIKQAVKAATRETQPVVDDPQEAAKRPYVEISLLDFVRKKQIPTQEEVGNRVAKALGFTDEEMTLYAAEKGIYTSPGQAFMAFPAGEETGKYYLNRAAEHWAGDVRVGEAHAGAIQETKDWLKAHRAQTAPPIDVKRPEQTTGEAVFAYVYNPLANGADTASSAVADIVQGVGLPAHLFTNHTVADTWADGLRKWGHSLPMMNLYTDDQLHSAGAILTNIYAQAGGSTLPYLAGGPGARALGFSAEGATLISEAVGTTANAGAVYNDALDNQSREQAQKELTGGELTADQFNQRVEQIKEGKGINATQRSNMDWHALAASSLAAPLGFVQGRIFAGLSEPNLNVSLPRRLGDGTVIASLTSGSMHVGNQFALGLSGSENAGQALSNMGTGLPEALGRGALSGTFLSLGARKNNINLSDELPGKAAANTEIPVVSRESAPTTVTEASDGSTAAKPEGKGTVVDPPPVQVKQGESKVVAEDPGPAGPDPSTARNFADPEFNLQHWHEFSEAERIQALETMNNSDAKIRDNFLLGFDQVPDHIKYLSHLSSPAIERLVELGSDIDRTKALLALYGDKIPPAVATIMQQKAFSQFNQADVEVLDQHLSELPERVQKEAVEALTRKADEEADAELAAALKANPHSSVLDHDADTYSDDRPRNGDQPVDMGVPTSSRFYKDEEGTLYELTADHRKIFHYPDKTMELFPKETPERYVKGLPPGLEWDSLFVLSNGNKLWHSENGYRVEIDEQGHVVRNDPGSNDPANRETVTVFNDRKETVHNNGEKEILFRAKDGSFTGTKMTIEGRTVDIIGPEQQAYFDGKELTVADSHKPYTERMWFEDGTQMRKLADSKREYVNSEGQIVPALPEQTSLPTKPTIEVEPEQITIRRGNGRTDVFVLDDQHQIREVVEYYADGRVVVDDGINRSQQNGDNVTTTPYPLTQKLIEWSKQVP